MRAANPILWTSASTSVLIIVTSAKEPTSTPRTVSSITNGILTGGCRSGGFLASVTSSTGRRCSQCVSDVIMNHVARKKTSEKALVAQTCTIPKASALAKTALDQTRGLNCSQSLTSSDLLLSAWLVIPLDNPLCVTKAAVDHAGPLPQ